MRAKEVDGWETRWPSNDVTWAPCDQEGNPLPLVAARDGWKKTADDHYRMHRHASQELKRERARADKAEQERDAERARANKAEANYRWMVEREAERKLDGYSELVDKAAAAANERDRLRHELAVVEEEFGITTGHGPEALREAIREWSLQQQWDQGPGEDL